MNNLREMYDWLPRWVSFTIIIGGLSLFVLILCGSIFSSIVCRDAGYVEAVWVKYDGNYCKTKDGILVPFDRATAK